MNRNDINRLIWESFPNARVKQIDRLSSGRIIVRFTDEAGNNQIAELMNYMGVNVINFVSKEA